MADALAKALDQAGARRTSGTASSRPAPIAVPQLRAGDIDLGSIDTGGAIGVDLKKLMVGRLLVQGASGAGKSWLLRRLLEQSHGRVQQIVVDPEGEFKSLAEAFNLKHVDAARLDIAAISIAAKRAREHQISVHLDLSELDREGQMKAVAAFFSALIEAPRAHWHPCLVAVDEAHLFAPFGGQASEANSVRKAAIAAVTDLMSRGRKRGLCGVLATQRLARLAKSVVSEVHNFLIGLNTLDLDIRRAAETIGWDARRAFDRLPALEPGEFVATGPAFSRSPAIAIIGGVTTHHSGEAPAISNASQIDPKRANELLDLDALYESSAADEVMLLEERLPQGTKAVRELIRDPAFPLAGAIWGGLLPLIPDGALISELAKAFDANKEQVAASLDLLDRFGVIEFIGEGTERAVRVAKAMRP
jgi:GTPase SAR1 family protein